MATFSLSVTKRLNHKIREDIRDAVIGSPELKKEIQRVLKQANERARRIEKAGITSPAYQALELEGRTGSGYSKFNLKMLDIRNESDWTWAKYEYSKAIEFLNNPTSSVTGAREYIKNTAKKYDVDPDTAMTFIKVATETKNLDGGGINLLNYRAVLDQLIKDARNDKTTMEQSAKERANAMEQALKENAEQVADILEDATELMIQALEKGLKLF